MLIFLLLVILVYPSSTILFPPDSIDPRSFFVVVALIIIFESLWKKDKSFGGLHHQLLIILIFLSEIFLIVKYLIDFQELYIFRNIIIGFILLAMVTRGEKFIQNKIFQLISFLSVVVLFSNAVLFIYLSNYDINSIEFSVINLRYLNHLNPAITRTDFTYIIPWYLTTIPVGYLEDFFLGLSYQRYSNIFSEWTYLWYYVCPILIIRSQKKSIINLLCIIQIVIILILGLSVWGLGSLILSYVIAYIAKLINSYKLLILVFIFSAPLFFFELFDVDAIKILLDGIGSYRFEQVNYYLGGFNLSEITLFGSVTPPDSFEILWGVNYILWQYGMGGFGLLILLQIYATCIAIKILCRPDVFSNQDRSLSTTLIFLTLMGSKTPIFFPFLQILIASVLSRKLYLKK
ncbi:hypothetical protein [Polynucleobacter sp. MWH-UH2A]|uniref:hypothetical protein n=1 Tax=Polynucleobacter sp. MWH-UH2A TaxID=1855617 RepID=UPI001BFEA288|nr:hypothetical protein [Polynucleobacter sp. MWH-UH2A]QWD64382.1 hypothetical protein IC571_01755 [Polynucleobacter sp. MWH-UH2A]